MNEPQTYEPGSQTTKPPTTADASALEYARRLAVIDGKRRNGTSGLLRALAEADAELNGT